SLASQTQIASVRATMSVRMPRRVRSASALNRTTACVSASSSSPVVARTIVSMTTLYRPHRRLSISKAVNIEHLQCADTDVSFLAAWFSGAWPARQAPRGPRASVRRLCGADKGADEAPAGIGSRAAATIRLAGVLHCARYHDLGPRKPGRAEQRAV